MICVRHLIRINVLNDMIYNYNSLSSKYIRTIAYRVLRRTNSSKAYYRPSNPTYCFCYEINIISNFSSSLIFQTRPYSKKGKPTPSGATNKQNSKEKTLQGGVTIADVVLGSGSSATSGNTVTVYYSGRLRETNKLFDSMTSGRGLTFRLGKGEVIDGWDIGLVGMKVGGKRVITCPPDMAYGAEGSPPKIPSNSTLVFEVELKAVK